MSDIEIEPATDDDLRAMLAAVCSGHPLSLRESGKLIARLAAMQELIEVERNRADAAEQDAARYRWLAQSDWYVGPDDIGEYFGGISGYSNFNHGKERLDHAIDAAMKAKKSK